MYGYGSFDRAYQLQRFDNDVIMKKSKVTEYQQYSSFSGKPAECQHHLIYGRGWHRLADEDGLIIGLTNEEHNLSPYGTINQIHDNPAAEKLSKIAGQLAWERNYLIKQLGLPFESEEETFERVSSECREAFRKRYSISFL